MAKLGAAAPRRMCHDNPFPWLRVARGHRNQGVRSSARPVLISEQSVPMNLRGFAALPRSAQATTMDHTLLRRVIMRTLTLGSIGLLVGCAAVGCGASNEGTPPEEDELNARSGDSIVF